MHILAQKKGKISFGLSRKNPKFEKYTDFKPHLIRSIAHVTAKMKCDAVMVLAKCKTALHRTYDRKNKVRYNYSFS